jgi:hypothetical protein
VALVFFLVLKLTFLAWLHIKFCSSRKKLIDSLLEINPSWLSLIHELSSRKKKLVKQLFHKPQAEPELRLQLISGSLVSFAVLLRSVHKLQPSIKL